MSDLTNRFKKVMAPTSHEPLGLEVVSADGVHLYDANGKGHIDLISGISVSSLGHGHPKIKKAITDQLERSSFVMVYGEMVLPPQVEFAENLMSHLPEDLNSVYFVNSGSEVVEGAMKLAKRYTGRPNIIGLDLAYHGSSHGALSLMGEESFKSAFRPLLPGVHHIEPENADHLEQIDSETAAVFVEPIQGEAGCRVLSSEYLKALEHRCNEVGALLVFDEIQTGYGRTGSLYYFEQIGVVPDILLTAKAFGGGMPIGAFIASAEMMDCFTHDPILGHITTFGGHPICCAAGNAALNILMEDDLIDIVPQKEGLIRKQLRHEKITEIRGVGLLLAAELNDAELVVKVMRNVLEKGVVVDWFLFCDTAIRIAPPLTISESELKEACAKLLQAINEEAQ